MRFKMQKILKYGALQCSRASPTICSGCGNGWPPFVLGKKKCADQKKFNQGKRNSQIRRLHTASAHRTASIQEELILFWGDEYFTAQRDPLWWSLQLWDPSHSRTHVCLTIPSYVCSSSNWGWKPPASRGKSLSSKFPGMSYLCSSHPPALKMLRKHTGSSATVCMLTSLQGKALFLSHAPPSHKATVDRDC